MSLYVEYCQSYKFLILLKLGRFCVVIFPLSADSIFALHKTDRTGKTNVQKGGVNR